MSLTDVTKAFIGFGFYVYKAEIHIEYIGDSPLHLFLEKLKSWGLGMNNDIKINDFPPVVGKLGADDTKKIAAVGVLESGVLVGKHRANITHTGCAKQGINNGVEYNIPVTMAQKAEIERHLNTTEHKPSVRHKPMDVGTYAGTVFVICLKPDAHSTPFVLGMSPPVILTALARD